MKKIIAILVALISTTTIMVAQSGKSSKEIRQQYFVFGPTAGLSMPYQHIVTNTTALSQLLGAPNVGVQFGGYARGILPLKKTKIVLYAQLDAAWAMDFYVGGGSSASAGCFNFPLTVGGGYKLSDKTLLRVACGPTLTANVYTSANTAFKDTDDKYQSEVADMLNRNRWGWVAVIGADYKAWTFDLRYMNQFSSNAYNRIADECRFISLGLTVGYKF